MKWLVIYRITSLLVTLFVSLGVFRMLMLKISCHLKSKFARWKNTVLSILEQVLPFHRHNSQCSEEEKKEKTYTSIKIVSARAFYSCVGILCALSISPTCVGTQVADPGIMCGDRYTIMGAQQARALPKIGPTMGGFIHFCIRMLKSTAEIARESIKTTPELPWPLNGPWTPAESQSGTALVMCVRAHNLLRPPPHENPGSAPGTECFKRISSFKPFKYCVCF